MSHRNRITELLSECFSLPALVEHVREELIELWERVESKEQIGGITVMAISSISGVVGNTFNLGEVVTSTNEVVTGETFTSSDPNIASVSGNILTLVAVGTCKITADDVKDAAGEVVKGGELDVTVTAAEVDVDGTITATKI